MFQPQSGFEFLGTSDGKVFLRPIYDDATNSDYLTYQEAITKCTAAGYQIATVESQQQCDLLKPYVCKGTRWSWIDGVDFQSADNFFSINTGRNLTFFEWESGRPVKGKDDRHCMRLSCQNSNVNNAKMWDVECTDKLSVICQVTA